MNYELKSLALCNSTLLFYGFSRMPGWETLSRYLVSRLTIVSKLVIESTVFYLHFPVSPVFDPRSKMKSTVFGHRQTSPCHANLVIYLTCRPLEE